MRTEKRAAVVLLVLALVLGGCAAPSASGGQKQYTATFLELFDTVTTVIGKADSEEDFRATAEEIRDELMQYHQLFDIYHDYAGLNNLKTVNDNAGIAPVAVDERILDLLEACKGYYEVTDGRVNIAMGGVLRLWHEERNTGVQDPSNAKLPSEEKLRRAGEHMDLNALVIDRENAAVYLSDPLASLDVGAVAKGWSAQRVCENAPAGLLISVGGNVCATGPKDPAGTPWVVGIQDPNGSDKYLHTIYVTGGSVVTSGDYQRAYAVDGRLYHHIIDPDTLYPGGDWRSVTVVCADSGLADALSTALFLLPQAEGQAILGKFQAEAMWVDAEGNISYSPEFEALIKI